MFIEVEVARARFFELLLRPPEFVVLHLELDVVDGKLLIQFLDVVSIRDAGNFPPVLCQQFLGFFPKFVDFVRRSLLGHAPSL